MFRKVKNKNPNVWKSKNREFQSLEKQKIENSNVWKSKNREFQCLEK